jgi:Uma2 family endonuclease
MPRMPPSTLFKPANSSDPGQLLPAQGEWTESDYLAINRHTHRLIEMSNAHLEILPTPTKSHQQIVLFLYGLLVAHLTPQRLGMALVAPYPMRLWPGKFREPDVLVMLAAHSHRLGEAFAEGADLVIEVLSDDREKDLVLKRAEYARARIPEYWIVDPVEKLIIVLKLSGRKYVVHGKYHEGQIARSATLKGFVADVQAVMDAGTE